MQAEFFVYVTWDVNEDHPRIRKLSFDNKIFYDMPTVLQHIDHHPLIKSCSQFINFKKMFQEKTTKFKDSYNIYI